MTIQAFTKTGCSFRLLNPRTLRVTAGTVRDDVDGSTITVPETDIDINTVGAAGLDTGSIAAGTYAVYAQGPTSVTCVLSTAIVDAPTLVDSHTTYGFLGYIDVVQRAAGIFEFTGSFDNYEAALGPLPLFMRATARMWATVVTAIGTADTWIGNVVGNLTGNVTGNVTGTASGNLSGSGTSQLAGLAHDASPASGALFLFEKVDGTLRQLTRAELATALGVGANVHADGLWNGLYAEGSVDAASDYFSDSSLDAKWTEWDVDGTLTVTEGAYRLKLSQATQAAFAMAGIHEAAPAYAQYNLTAYLTASCDIAGDTLAFGIFVAEDIAGSPSTGNYQSIGLAFRVAPEIDLDASLYGTAYTNVTVDKQVDDWGWSGGCFLRIWVDNTGNQFKLLVSQDGQAWTCVRTIAQASSAVTGDPVRIGIYINNINTGLTQVVYCRMFRVDSSADAFAPIGAFMAA